MTKPLAALAAGLMLLLAAQGALAQAASGQAAVGDWIGTLQITPAVSAAPGRAYP